MLETASIIHSANGGVKASQALADIATEIRRDNRASYRRTAMTGDFSQNEARRLSYPYQHVTPDRGILSSYWRDRSFLDYYHQRLSSMLFNRHAQEIDRSEFDSGRPHHCDMVFL